MKRLLLIFVAISFVLLMFASCVDGGTGDIGGTGGNGGVGGNGGNGGSGTTDTPATATSEVLIAYFSCTNTTEAVAKHIQAETKGTLYEIVAAVPYTEDDLKYYTNCRADKEQADANSRPAISGSVEDMDNYSIVFVGYPIWHGQAPRIISTFLESYDFEGKTIVPFCTSASSGIGSSDTNLHSLAPTAEWLDGKRFPSGTSQQTVADWLNSLNVNLTPDDTSEQPDNEEITKMYITVNGNKLEVTLAQNSAVDELVKRLKQGDVTYNAHDYGGFEKVGGLEFSLPTNDTQITTQAGDVILYSGNQIVLFYGSNSWDYTRLGKINGYSASELKTLLGAGDGNVEVTISLT